MSQWPGGRKHFPTTDPVVTPSVLFDEIPDSAACKCHTQNEVGKIAYRYRRGPGVFGPHSPTPAPAFRPLAVTSDFRTCDMRRGVDSVKDSGSEQKKIYQDFFRPSKRASTAQPVRDPISGEGVVPRVFRSSIKTVPDVRKLESLEQAPVIANTPRNSLGGQRLSLDVLDWQADPQPTRKLSIKDDPKRFSMMVEAAKQLKADVLSARKQRHELHVKSVSELLTWKDS